MTVCYKVKMIFEENSCAYCMDLWDIISYDQIAGFEEAFGVDLSLGQALRPLTLASTHLSLLVTIASTIL